MVNKKLELIQTLNEKNNQLDFFPHNLTILSDVERRIVNFLKEQDHTLTTRQIYFNIVYDMAFDTTDFGIMEVYFDEKNRDRLRNESEWENVPMESFIEKKAKNKFLASSDLNKMELLRSFSIKTKVSVLGYPTIQRALTRLKKEHWVVERNKQYQLSIEVRSAWEQYEKGLK